MDRLNKQTVLENLTCKLVKDMLLGLKPTRRMPGIGRILFLPFPSSAIYILCTLSSHISFKRDEDESLNGFAEGISTAGSKNLAIFVASSINM